MREHGRSVLISMEDSLGSCRGSGQGKPTVTLDEYESGRGALQGLKLKTVWTKKRGRGYRQETSTGKLVGRTGSRSSSNANEGATYSTPWTICYDDGSTEYGFFGSGFKVFYVVGNGSEARVSPLARAVEWIGPTPSWSEGAHTPEHHAAVAADAEQQPVPKGITSQGGRGQACTGAGGSSGSGDGRGAGDVGIAGRTRGRRLLDSPEPNQQPLSNGHGNECSSSEQDSGDDGHNSYGSHRRSTDCSSDGEGLDKEVSQGVKGGWSQGHQGKKENATTERGAQGKQSTARSVPQGEQQQRGTKRQQEGAPCPGAGDNSTRAGNAAGCPPSAKRPMPKAGIKHPQTMPVPPPTQQQPQQQQQERQQPRVVQTTQQQQQQQQSTTVTRIGGTRRLAAVLLGGGRVYGSNKAGAGEPGSGVVDSPAWEPSDCDRSNGPCDSDSEGILVATEREEAMRAAEAAVAADAAVDTVLSGLSGTGASIKSSAARLLQLCEEDGGGKGPRRTVARILARMESVPVGAPRVNLLYLTDCLLSHARRDDASACIRDLPAMAGAGLPRMLQLAATDRASLERVERALEAWGRKGLLEPGYLRLGRERLEALAMGIKKVGQGPAAAINPGHQQHPQKSGTQGPQGLQQASQMDPRLVQLILTAPAQVTTEAALLPGLRSKVLRIEEERQQQLEEAAAAVAAAEAELANLLEGEGGAGDSPTPAHQIQEAQPAADTQPPPVTRGMQGGDQQGLSSSIPLLSDTRACTSNLFGPAFEMAYVMDPFGSMTGSSSTGGSGNPGAPLLQHLLAHAALALRPRPDPSLRTLPDPAEEALTDGRVGTWREVLQPLAQAEKAEVSTAMAAVATAAPDASAAADYDGQEPWAEQEWSEQQWHWQVQPQPEIEASEPQGDEDEWMFDDAAADTTEWMAHVPAAPKREEIHDAIWDDEQGYSAPPGATSLPPPWDRMHYQQQQQQLQADVLLAARHWQHGYQHQQQRLQLQRAPYFHEPQAIAHAATAYADEAVQWGTMAQEDVGGWPQEQQQQQQQEQQYMAAGFYAESPASELDDLEQQSPGDAPMRLPPPPPAIGGLPGIPAPRLPPVGTAAAGGLPGVPAPPRAQAHASGGSGVAPHRK